MGLLEELANRPDGNSVTNQDILRCMLEVKQDLSDRLNKIEVRMQELDDVKMEVVARAATIQRVTIRYVSRYRPCDTNTYRDTAVKKKIG